jgi:hypothetical protein
MVSPPESASLRQLYAAGAHVDALARVLGRDPRTVRAALRREGLRLRRDPPLPRDWHAGLPAATVQAIEAYLTQLQTREQHAWARLQQAALEVAAATYVFPDPATYTAALQPAEPAESVLALARRLGVDVNRVLLAAAAWLEEAEAQRWEEGWR